jgi:hypothetical protein
MPLRLEDVNVGDYVYSDATGRTILKVVAIDSEMSAVKLWNNRTKRMKTLEFESLEKYWSMGVPEHGWRFKN